MNDHLDTDLGEEATAGPVDNEGRPMDPPVLSMEVSRDGEPGAAFPVDLPDLNLSEPAGAVAVGLVSGPSGVPSMSTQASAIRPRQILAAPTGMTVMPKGWNLDGNIESSDAVTIGCQVKGQIEMTSSSRVEVLPGAAVVGSIRGVDVVIRGLVEGEINAGGGTVSIEEGATIRGKVSYTGIRMSGGEHQMELVHIPRQAAANSH